VNLVDTSLHQQTTGSLWILHRTWIYVRAFLWVVFLVRMSLASLYPVITGLLNGIQLSYLRETRRAAVETVRDSRHTFDWGSKNSTEDLKLAGFRIKLKKFIYEKWGCDNHSIAQCSSKALYHMHGGLLVSEASFDWFLAAKVT